MKRSLLALLLLSMFAPLLAQTGLPEDRITEAEVTAHMRFLASDLLAGRRTGSPGIDIAAQYLSSFYASYGLQPAPGMDSYFQAVPYEETTPPPSGAISFDDKVFVQGEDLLLLEAEQLPETKLKYVFASYGIIDEASGRNDYEGINAKGKVVVTYLGLPGEENASVIFASVNDKERWAKEQGAVGLIELYRLRFPWGFMLRYFNKSQINLSADDAGDTGDFFYGWLRDDEGSVGEYFVGKDKGKMTVFCGGSTQRRFTSPNVIGYLPGTDPVLRDEYVILSAHYDHVGVGEQGGGKYDDQDSIFNGSRDNAFGTVALLAAAKSFSQAPPRRSILFVAYSGEELGLLGSSYFADHPVMPLEQAVFNLNTDGAGYNDTEAVSIIGYGRMDIDAQLDSGAAAYGLRIIANPAPEQNLFDRSDNVSLAIKGVPAPCFSPGISGFTKEISKYYHQVADNPETIDFAYLRVFSQAFTHAARLIADRDQRPIWEKDDKYEPAFKQLYGD